MKKPTDPLSRQLRRELIREGIRTIIGALALFLTAYLALVLLG